MPRRRDRPGHLARTALARWPALGRRARRMCSRPSAPTPANHGALAALFARSARLNPADAALFDQHPELLCLKKAPRHEQTRVDWVDGVIVAFARLAPCRAGLEVTALFVAPEHQGRGFGRQLIADATRRARLLGAVALEANINPAALAFYVRLGLATIASAMTDAGPVPRMRKELDQPTLPTRAELTAPARRRRRPPRTAPPHRAP